jgi:hypothetical protein
MAIIWVGTGRFEAALDPDALAYITAVETADGQALETAVRDAINAFVVGCKADGIWPAIKASCIMAGARTLAGALVPLVGPAPTNFNFVAGDYNRKTGLVGNGSTKYLNSNRNNNADPQDSRHLAVYMTTPNTMDPAIIIGTSNVTGRTTIVNVTTTTARMSSASVPINSITPVTGFLGGVRTNATTSAIRNNGVTTVSAVASETPTSEAMGVFGSTAPTGRSNPRLAYYSIGESLDLALLDARVTTLVNTFGAVIP